MVSQLLEFAPLLGLPGQVFGEQRLHDLGVALE
jgi:hypothetical protein